MKKKNVRIPMGLNFYKNYILNNEDAMKIQRSNQVLSRVVNLIVLHKLKMST